MPNLAISAAFCSDDRLWANVSGGTARAPAGPMSCPRKWASSKHDLRSAVWRQTTLLVTGFRLSPACAGSAGMTASPIQPTPGEAEQSLRHEDDHRDED